MMFRQCLANGIKKSFEHSPSSFIAGSFFLCASMRGKHRNGGRVLMHPPRSPATASFNSDIINNAKQYASERFKSNFNNRLFVTPFSHVFMSNKEFLTWATKFMTWATK